MKIQIYNCPIKETRINNYINEYRTYANSHLICNVAFSEIIKDLDIILYSDLTELMEKLSTLITDSVVLIEIQNRLAENKYFMRYPFIFLQCGLKEEWDFKITLYEELSHAWFEYAKQPLEYLWKSSDLMEQIIQNLEVQKKEIEWDFLNQLMNTIFNDLKHFYLFKTLLMIFKDSEEEKYIQKELEENLRLAVGIIIKKNYDSKTFLEYLMRIAIVETLGVAQLKDVNQTIYNKYETLYNNILTELQRTNLDKKDNIIKSLSTILNWLNNSFSM